LLTISIRTHTIFHFKLAVKATLILVSDQVNDLLDAVIAIKKVVYRILQLDMNDQITKSLPGLLVDQSRQIFWMVIKLGCD